MRALLLALLLAPVAAAASAYPDGAELGDREARIPVRAQGVLHIVADVPIEAALAPPEGAPPSWSPTPTELAATGGAWRGLEGISVLWLRRDKVEPVLVEISDGAREGIAIEWPGQKTVPGASPLALALALVTGCGRRSRPRPRCRRGRP